MPATVRHLAFSKGENPGLLADTREKALLPSKKGMTGGISGKGFFKLLDCYLFCFYDTLEGAP
jgi:hypothetical protein